MKPLERIFFQSCIMRILLEPERKRTFREIANVFCALGFPPKRILYYFRKWCEIGFYEYGVAIDLGWFRPEEFTGEYKVMYEKILSQWGRKDNG